MNFKNKLSRAKESATEGMETLSVKSKGFFPIEEFFTDASEIVESCWRRHDVPHGDHIPYDLRDIKGDGLVNDDGFPTAGIIALEDYQMGGESPAIPLWLALWGPLLAFCLCLSSLGHGLGLLAPLFIITYLSFTHRMIGFRMTCVLIATGACGIGLTVGSGLITQFLPSALSIVSTKIWIAFFLPMFAIYFYQKAIKRVYVLSLAEMGAKFNGASIHNLRPFKEARIKQAAAALTDTSAFIKLGHATGTFSRKGDSFAPDAGLPFGQTTKDQTMHLIVTGATGSGKTTTLKNEIVGIIKDEIANQIGLSNNDCPFTDEEKEEILEYEFRKHMKEKQNKEKEMII